MPPTDTTLEVVKTIVGAILLLAVLAVAAVLCWHGSIQGILVGTLLTTIIAIGSTALAVTHTATATVKAVRQAHAAGVTSVLSSPVMQSHTLTSVAEPGPDSPTRRNPE